MIVYMLDILKVRYFCNLLFICVLHFILYSKTSVIKTYNIIHPSHVIHVYNFPRNTCMSVEASAVVICWYRKSLKLCSVLLEFLGTVDYVLSDSTLVFRTHPSEKDRLVFQMVSMYSYLVV